MLFWIELNNGSPFIKEFKSYNDCYNKVNNYCKAWDIDGFTILKLDEAVDIYGLTSEDIKNLTA